MEKVYRLLRNNQQTGPHTLEELIQLGLKPYDLIWVEGRSYGWQYPSEVPTLKAYAPEAPVETKKAEPKKEEKKSESPAAPKRIFVSKPSAPSAPSAPASEPSYSIEEKAEALRQRIANYTPSTSSDDNMQTHYQREVDDIGVDYGAWLYEKKKKKKNYGKLVLLPLVLAAAGFALYKYWPAATSSPLTVMPAAIVATPEKNEEREERVFQDENSFAPIDSTYVVDSINPELKNYTPGPRVASLGAKRNTGNKSSATDTVQDVMQEHVPQPVDEEPVVVQHEERPAAPAAEPEKKKKGIKGFFGKIFGKKKDKKEEEAEPSFVDITGQVELKTSRSNSGGWMMGVQNQKLTLSNRSSAKLVKASIEVKYFSENNTLLEKKIVVFQEVSPRSSGTLPVPDHRTADHAVFKVLSATGLGSSQR